MRIIKVRDTAATKVVDHIQTKPTYNHHLQHFKLHSVQLCWFWVNMFMSLRQTIHSVWVNFDSCINMIKCINLYCNEQFASWWSVGPVLSSFSTRQVKSKMSVWSEKSEQGSIPLGCVVVDGVWKGRWGGARCLGMLGRSTRGRPWLGSIMKD